MFHLYNFNLKTLTCVYVKSLTSCFKTVLQSSLSFSLNNGHIAKDMSKLFPDPHKQEMKHSIKLFTGKITVICISSTSKRNIEGFSTRKNGKALDAKKAISPQENVRDEISIATLLSK